MCSVKPQGTAAIPVSVLLALAVSISSQSLAKDARKPTEHRRAVPTKSIRVDANTVLCIADRGIQPSSRPVPQKGKRPAGLAVSGVGALGLGVADGDVLTEVLGQPVRSQAQVVAMVMVARNQNMSEISATVWHGTQPYSVTVEQPYDVPNCSAEEPSCWRSRCRSEERIPAVAPEKRAPKR